ncbi:prephenate dehydratase domain-containing protein [Nostoc sp. NIES-2111]
MKIPPRCAAVITMLSMSICTAAAAAAAARTGYLGPAGSWTHQACLELFAEEELVALERETLFEALRAGTIERACVPVTTSVGGAKPFHHDVLAPASSAGAQVAAAPPNAGSGLASQRTIRSDAPSAPSAIKLVDRKAP